MRRRVNQVIAAVGKEFSSALVHTCLLDQSHAELMASWRVHPQAEMVKLRQALDGLARHYGV